MKNLMTSAVLMIGLALSGWAVAQDGSLEPTFGSYELVTGFAPDPQTLDITATGTVDAAALGEQCEGYVAEAPDLRVTFTAGSLPLTVRAESDDDVTLVVYSPDEMWHCNEDDPIYFQTPLSGDYILWVATLDPEPASAVVFFTELPE